MQNRQFNSLAILMNRNNLPEIDLKLILFVILMMLLPFILFSKNEADNYGHPPMPLPIDTIGTDTSGVIMNFTEDTLDENFPAVYSPLNFNLISIPADTVVITAFPDGQLNLGAGAGVAVQLIFPPYPVALSPQEIKVKPYDDIIYEDFHSGQITFTVTSDDPEYAVYTIDELSYFIEDDELVPGINFEFEVDTFLTEGLTGVTWLLSLNSIPTDTVFITVDPDAQIRITGTPDEAVTLAFPPNASSLGWQDLPVRANDDDVYEGMHSGSIIFSVTTDDDIYNDFILDPVEYVIYDNDSMPGIKFVYDVDTFLTEGLAGVPLMFALNSIPSDTVFLTADPDGQMRIAAVPDDPLLIVFPPNPSALSWQTFNIRAFDDLVFEGSHTGLLQFNLVTADTAYDDLVLADVNFDIADNDLAPAINFSVPAVLELNEWDGELELNISLTSVPADTVHITITPDMQLTLTGIAGEPYELVFEPDASAMNDQIASVHAFNDFDFEGTHTGILNFDITATDPDYSVFTLDPLTITIYDDDLMPGINFSDTSELANVEGDTTLFFTIVLNSIPQSTVTINANPDNQLDLGKGKGIDVNFKFKEDSALIAQMVNVIPFDDLYVEGDHLGKIGFEVLTSDVNYLTFTIDTIVVEITDNDIVSIATYQPDQMNLFPTVSNGLFQITYSDDARINRLTVYNGAGAIAFEQTAPANSSLIDLSHLANGSYTVIASMSNGRYYQRIEIIR